MQMPQTLRLDDEKGELIILDQTMLPNEMKYLRISKTEEIWEAIKIRLISRCPECSAFEHGRCASNIHGGSSLPRYFKTYGGQSFLGPG